MGYKIKNITIDGNVVLDGKQLLGDNASQLQAIMMHSAVYTALQKQNLIQYTTVQGPSGSPIKIPTYLTYSVVVDDGIAYIMSYIYNEDKSYTTKIYSTKDFEVFNKIYEFDIDTTPVSFEYYDNSFYIGTDLGEKGECKDSSKNGSLYKVTLIK